MRPRRSAGSAIVALGRPTCRAGVVPGSRPPRSARRWRARRRCAQERRHHGSFALPDRPRSPSRSWTSRASSLSGTRFRFRHPPRLQRLGRSQWYHVATAMMAPRDLRATRPPTSLETRLREGLDALAARTRARAFLYPLDAPSRPSPAIRGALDELGEIFRAGRAVIAAAPGEPPRLSRRSV